MSMYVGGTPRTELDAAAASAAKVERDEFTGMMPKPEDRYRHVLEALLEQGLIKLPAQAQAEIDAAYQQAEEQVRNHARHLATAMRGRAASLDDPEKDIWLKAAKWIEPKPNNLPTDEYPNTGGHHRA